MPFNVSECPRHLVSVASVDYFCVNCYYLKNGECKWVGPARDKRVVRSLRDLIKDGLGRAD